MKQIGEYQIFEKDEQLPPEIQKEFSTIPEGVIFPYGVKQEEIDGKKYWTACTKEDYLKTISDLSGKYKFQIDGQCRLTRYHGEWRCFSVTCRQAQGACGRVYLNLTKPPQYQCICVPIM